MKKKNSFIMKKNEKKNLSIKFGNSYCINSIVRSKFVLRQWARQLARCLGVAWALGARPGRLGCPGLCTWCTRPFLARFDSVFS